MPIREYVCSKCGLEFESIDIGPARGSAPPLTVCPKCGSKKVERVPSPFSSPGDSSSSSCGTKPSSRRFG